MNDRIGKELGNYGLTGLIGRGDLGEVYLGEQRNGKRQFAIKVFSTSLTDDQTNGFLNDAGTIADLDHPNIMRIRDDFDVENGSPFLAMNYASNGNLRNRHPRGTPLPLDTIVRYVKQVAAALQYAHGRNIIHRDIKPENMLLGRNNQVLLSDFSIPIIADDTLDQNSPKGADTIAYKAPEQLQGRPCPASDLYALGVVVYEWLSGERPFQGSYYDLYAQHRFLPPPPLPTIPTIPSDVEQVVLRALAKEPDQRFASVQDFADALEQACQSEFPTDVREQVREQAPPPPPPPPPPGPRPVQPTPRPVRRRYLILLVAAVFLLFVALLSAARLFPSRGAGRSSATPTAPLPPNGIGVNVAPDSEPIGISDGTFAFDTGRPDGDLKSQAAGKLKKRDISGAELLWQKALKQETNDAETLIYQEDQHVLASGRDYITLVIGTILTGGSANIGRDSLQGAYVAQKEYNDDCAFPRCRQVRLLIANSGSGDSSNNEVAYTSVVMEQIAQAARADPKIVGVMGWPVSSSSFYATTVLRTAGIPMVSPTTPIVSSTQTPPYFFSIAPSNENQGSVDAQYAKQTLHARQVALFVDPVDRYSENLANEFSKKFKTDGNTIVATENYTVGKPETLPALLHDALGNNPNLIYFAGYAKDASALLTDLPRTGQFANLRVMGGDGLYKLDYSTSARNNLYRLRFTAFAYPDEWDVLGLTARKPAFFTDYPAAFDPDHKNTGNPYGFSRADSDVILSYDAMQALLYASNIAFNNAFSKEKQSFTPSDLQQALTQVTGLQGVSGQISFGPDGSSINKAVVIVYLDRYGHFKMEPGISGCFLKSPSTIAPNLSCS